MAERDIFDEVDPIDFEPKVPMEDEGVTPESLLEDHLREMEEAALEAARLAEVSRNYEAGILEDLADAGRSTKRSKPTKPACEWTREQLQSAIEEAVAHAPGRGSLPPWEVDRYRRSVFRFSTASGADATSAPSNNERNTAHETHAPAQAYIRNHHTRTPWIPVVHVRDGDR